MKNLNNIRGFVGATRHEEDYFKVKVQNESFWLRDCKQDPCGVWSGIVDNELLSTDNHGLKFNDEVEFELMQ